MYSHPDHDVYEDRGAITALAKLHHDLHRCCYDAADGAPDQNRLIREHSNAVEDYVLANAQSTWHRGRAERQQRIGIGRRPRKRSGRKSGLGYVSGSLCTA